jgi:hypothetical protein
MNAERGGGELETVFSFEFSVFSLCLNWKLKTVY